jgi:hypothetical protein
VPPRPSVRHQRHHTRVSSKPKPKLEGAAEIQGPIEGLRDGYVLIFEYKHTAPNPWHSGYVLFSELPRVARLARLPAGTDEPRWYLAHPGGTFAESMDHNPPIGMAYKRTRPTPPPPHTPRAPIHCSHCARTHGEDQADSTQKVFFNTCIADMPCT